MRRALVLAAALALSACNMDATAPGTSVEGSYTLRTINGSSLPYTFNTGLTLTSEVLTLYRDGTYQDLSRYSDGSTFVDSGDYTSYNGSITFDSDRSSLIYQGSLSGSVLTEIVNGYTQTFQKN
jgi:hypothetical protein